MIASHDALMEAFLLVVALVAYSVPTKASVQRSTMDLFAPNSTWVIGPNQRTMMRPEGLRSYLVHVPAALTEPPALILDFHSLFLQKESQASLSGLQVFSDTLRPQKFMVAYPQGILGIQNAFSTPGCCAYLNEPVDDIGFMEAIVADIKNNMRIDPRRIYMYGYSGGAVASIYFSYKLNHMIAAISYNAYSFSELYYQEALEAQQSDPNFHPIPVMAINGYSDKIVCWEAKCILNLLDHSKKQRLFNNAMLGWHRWAQFNNCTGEPVTIAEKPTTFWSRFNFDHTDYKWIKAYRNCSGGVEVRQVLNSNSHGGADTLYIIGRSGVDQQPLITEQVVEFLLRWSLPGYVNVTVPDWWSDS